MLSAPVQIHPSMRKADIMHRTRHRRDSTGQKNAAAPPCGFNLLVLSAAACGKILSMLWEKHDMHDP